MAAHTPYEHTARSMGIRVDVTDVASTLERLGDEGDGQPALGKTR